jgi:hypothetical protein
MEHSLPEPHVSGQIGDTALRKVFGGLTNDFVIYRYSIPCMFSENLEYLITRKRTAWDRLVENSVNTTAKSTDPSNLAADFHLTKMALVSWC